MGQCASEKSLNQEMLDTYNMHGLWAVIVVLVLAQNSLEMQGYSIIRTPGIELGPDEVLKISITQSGWIMVEIAHGGKTVLNNTAVGRYTDLNVTFDDPGSYVITMRNTHYSKEKIVYSIAVSSKSHSREIILS